MSEQSPNPAVGSGQLAGRVAIVTGAAGGVGSGAARRYADEGASVVLTDISGPAVEAVAAEIRERGGEAFAIACDIADPEQIAAVVAATVQRYGTVDILANIAQGGLDQHKLLEEATAEQALYAYRTGPLQSMLFMQHCLPIMKEKGYGRVINTASGAAVHPTPGFSTYSMAKGAVMSLTRVASQEWGRYGIVTNTFLPVAKTPGFDLTEQGRAAAKQLVTMVPVGRFGTPYEDVSPLLVFLASEGAGYINGQAIAADGGLSLFT
ncbi:SDR family NAD(P)-dependent oxidoreductase [Actinoplanes couchii]|uniref:Short-chain dehydrogenase n=1 Tax=Actinoplanes couchii TaxID=403638 RepID=A0ABQ3XFS6_9ACTN|nr:SDR family oxidoreductase [Actinoplanes couchii]MDR6321690.1 NAD(P)-dependent dehydrogenase (short-subunit alcohol dehydrogenase family) [Actinoplanes couchii]GID57354.1 short-chain dehydrogenase [Actinoplanes couchii]